MSCVLIFSGNKRSLDLTSTNWKLFALEKVFLVFNPPEGWMSSAFKTVGKQTQHDSFLFSGLLISQLKSSDKLDLEILWLGTILNMFLCSTSFLSFFLSSSVLVKKPLFLLWGIRNSGKKYSFDEVVYSLKGDIKRVKMKYSNGNKKKEIWGALSIYLSDKKSSF